MALFRVVVTVAALAHVRAVRRWSIENHRGEPEVFLGEVEAAMERLRVVPFAGAPL